MSVELTEKAASEGTSFVEALAWLQDGRVVTRKGWEGQVLYKIPEEGVDTLVLEDPVQHQFITGAQVSGEDVLAHDWVLLADYDTQEG